MQLKLRWDLTTTLGLNKYMFKINNEKQQIGMSRIKETINKAPKIKE